MCGRQGPNKIKGIKNKTHFTALEEKSSGEVHKTCVMQQDILSKLDGKVSKYMISDSG